MHDDLPDDEFRMVRRAMNKLLGKAIYGEDFSADPGFAKIGQVGIDFGCGSMRLGRVVRIIRPLNGSCVLCLDLEQGDSGIGLALREMYMYHP